MPVTPAAPQDPVTIELNEMQNKARQQRQRYERAWLLQLSYYMGRQWVAVDPTGRLFEPQLAEWRVKHTDNRVNPVIRTEIAKMTKTKPAFVAVPRTADDDDVDAAKTAEQLLEYWWTELDLARKLRSGLLWSRVCSAGFWKVYWDSGAGDSVDVLADAQNNVLTHTDGRPMQADDPNIQQVLGAMPDDVQSGINRKRVAMGELCVEPRSPFDIYPDPLAGDDGLAGADWVIEESVHSPEWVQDRYGLLLEPDAAPQPGITESRMPTVPGLTQQASTKVGVKVKELWQKPCGKHPKGRWVVWAQEHVLKDEGNPYPWLPYVMFRGVPVPGRFWPTCIAEQLISPQTELNKARSQIAENMARIANPQILVSRYSSVDTDEPFLPGGVVEYDDTTQNSKPVYLQAPELPVYARERTKQIEESIQEISGQHEVSNAQVPAGVTAASAINLLQEQDDTRLGPDVAEMEVALGEAGKRLLELGAAYYTDERIIRIQGEDGQWAIFPFKGAMLQGNTHVQVQAGSAMPRSQAARQAAIQQFLTTLLQQGQPLNPANTAKAFKQYGVGGLEQLYADVNRNDEQVTRENRQLVGGFPVTVNTYDDDQAHITGHQDWMRSATYERMVRANPQAGMLTEQHLQAHKDRVQMAQQAQAQAQGQQQLQQELPLAQAQAQLNPPNAANGRQGGT